jgi:hypothetical protein
MERQICPPSVKLSRNRRSSATPGPAIERSGGRGLRSVFYKQIRSEPVAKRKEWQDKIRGDIWSGAVPSSEED